MWMADPRAMCHRHLLGEHVELHMLVGHLRRGRSIAGYAADNCVEPASVAARHGELAGEMARRGYRHASPLPRNPPTRHLPEDQRLACVDREKALAELLRRCPECRRRRKSLAIKGLQAANTEK